MKLGDNGEAFFVQEMEVQDVSIFTKGRFTQTKNPIASIRFIKSSFTSI